MSTARALTAAVAWTLPGFVRHRYREQWQADLYGARELGLSPWSVVGGAAMVAITIDRTDPYVTGITKGRLILNRTRWAGAFLGSATVLGSGLLLWGGYESLAFAPVGLGIQGLAFLFAILGLFACLGTLIVAFDANGKRTARVLGFGAVAVVAALAAMLVMPLLGILGAPLVLAILIIAVSGTSESSGSRPLPTWGRVLLALPFTVLTLAIVAAGVAHITVWNPLAKVPGSSLDEIYTAMAASNETPIDGVVMGWVLLCGAASMTLPILGSIPRLGSFFTVPRIVVGGLLVVGVTASSHWFAGFNMGMSLADTFMISGGDAAMSGAVIAIVGQIALVAALLIGLAPRGRHRVASSV